MTETARSGGTAPLPGPRGSPSTGWPHGATRPCRAHAEARLPASRRPAPFPGWCQLAGPGRSGAGGLPGPRLVPRSPPPGA
eukprot:3369113-Lingulodinium_polyedra.AAC.1